MRLVIRIDMDNDAFQPDFAPELSRILRYLADLPQIDTFKGIYDVNGNKCGEIDLIEE
ncbi:Jag_N domain-containing protein [Azospirillaceae bacterium]